MASTLVQRIVKPLDSQERIPVHAFIASSREFRRGSFSLRKLESSFKLSPAEQADVVSIGKKIDAGDYDLIEVWMWLLLGQSGYMTVAETIRILGL